MSTVSPSMAKKIRRCFFFSLAFVIVVPVLCIVFGKTLHPAEFAYIDLDSNDDVPRNQKIYLHADLTSADLKQGTMVIDWSIIWDTCDSTSTNCTSVNIYFDANLLHSDTNSSEPSDNNRPTAPTFIWNVTADDQDYYLSNSPKFQTELFVFPQHQYGAIHEVRHTYSSDVYYPFDRYFAGVLAFAEDASTNESVPLVLDSTAGLVEGLKISADVANASTLAQADLPQLIDIVVTLERGTLIKIYCIVITVIFWLITIMICLVMIMTVGFGFQQRNEIVVVPVGTVFAFTQLRSTMPGTPDGFGDILDFVGVLPCLVLLSISAVTMVGIYIFTDPAQDSREKLTWSALVQTLTRRGRATLENIETENTPMESYSTLPSSRFKNTAGGP
ncbi:hypothetical protein ARMSODRAFT_1028250 [Armillaria solidipes]|uniref:Uncharacterized protein n=1 Tax=Armillaria solidipes TaxID=1076256 RepID=A0A2H3B5Y1_9AGAR|nr:hypothetical protein ARMSODRAFT_1028250 [Armillaria solidipes]